MDDDAFPIPYPPHTRPDAAMSDKTKQNRGTAEFLQALGEPSRVAILKALSTGSKNVTEMAKLLNVEIVNVSHHLGVLRQAALVVDEKHGRFVVYSLNEKEATVKPNALRIERGDIAVEISLG